MNQATLIQKNIAASLRLARGNEWLLALFLIVLFRVKTVNLTELLTGILSAKLNWNQITSDCNGFN